MTSFGGTSPHVPVIYHGPFLLRQEQCDGYMPTNAKAVQGRARTALIGRDVLENGCECVPSPPIPARNSLIGANCATLVYG